MATLLAHVKVKAGMEKQWEEIARSVYEGTHTNEPDVRLYEYWRGSEPGTYYVLLSYQDNDGLLEHQVADYHHGTLSPEIYETITSEWVDPVDGGSPAPPSTTTIAERPDRDERWNTYAQRLSQPLPEWWKPLRSAKTS